MPTLHLAILALIQGVTEFLPVSSSAHLAVTPQLLGWQDQGLVIDVAVHVGTLGAVILYMHREIWEMVSGIGRMLKGRRDRGAKLAGLVIIATIPVIGAGFALNHYFPGGLRSLEVIAWATLGFGVLLYIVDHIGMTLRRIEHLEISDAILIGIAQCAALIPGTSRAGITMTAARLLGMERTDTARFSMLLSIPAIIGAGALKGYELWQSGNAQLTSDAFTAAGLAFITALIAIAVMMAWLRRASFTPFVVYRIILGLFLLAVAYGYVSI